MVKNIKGAKPLSQDMIGEWNYSRNTHLDINQVSAGTNKKAWWICSEGHEWETLISHRTRSGCPVCFKLRQVEISRKRAIAANPIPLEHIIRKEWHPLKNQLGPDEFSLGSGEKIWWLCSTCGHEWQAIIGHRSKRNHGCPLCAKTKGAQKAHQNAIRRNPLFKIPILIEEWHPTNNGDKNPQDFSCGSDEKVWWLCSTCGHEWECVIHKRSAGRGCNKCSARHQVSIIQTTICVTLTDLISSLMPSVRIGKYEFDMYSDVPKIAIEYDGLWYHRDRAAQDMLKKEWAINQGITFIRVREKGLPILSENDISYDYAHQTEEIYTQCIYDILKRVSICTGMHFAPKVYTEKYPIPDVTIDYTVSNNIAITHAHLMEEWHPDNNRKPQSITAGSDYKAKWKCKECRNVWEAIVSTRCKGSKCRKCSIQDRIKKASLNNPLNKEIRTMLDWHPTLNSMWNPENLSRSSSQSVWWLCHKCGYEWQQSVTNKYRSVRHKNCPDK